MLSRLFQATFYELSVGIIIFFTLFGWLIPLGIKIGYGRLKNSLVKFEVNPRLAWFLFQVPNLIWAAYFLILCKDKLSYGYALFILHYINRDIIYPLRMKSTNKVPLQIIFSAGLFTTANGYVQGISNQVIGKQKEHNFILLLLGTLLFFGGMYINIRSDQILQSTRTSRVKKVEDEPKQKKNTHNYVAINEFLFKYVASPNYLGEIIQWLGYFLVCQNLQSFLFFFSTLNILVAAAIPRSKWNKENIEGYPPTRKAVIPFIL